MAVPNYTGPGRFNPAAETADTRARRSIVRDDARSGEHSVGQRFRGRTLHIMNQQIHYISPFIDTYAA